jgi:hypothetical protein
MAFNRSLACKAARKNAHLEMAAPVPRSGVPHVAVAIVDDVELLGFERCFESTSNQRDAFGGHGAT